MNLIQLIWLVGTLFTTGYVLARMQDHTLFDISMTIMLSTLMWPFLLGYDICKGSQGQ